MMIRNAIAGLVLAASVVVTGAAGTLAQNATPEASPVAVADELLIPIDLVPWVVTDQMSPTAEQCTVDPVSTDDVADALIAIEPRGEPALTDNLLVEIAATGPPAQGVIDGVLETLTQFWACNNAGDRPAMVAVFTAQGIAELYGIDLELSDADLRAVVAASLTRGEPRPAEEVSGIDGIISIVMLQDGRVAALVVNTDPRIAGGSQVLDLIILANQGGRYLIDSFIGDPFNLTPGYGIDN
ncbi:MAG: hypothetical protein KF883_01930 [Thermomicrobiales bacterium]|nr:hypothetical protein [Thermomicrobiales bacterium]